MTVLTRRDGATILPERMDIAAARLLRDTVLSDTADLVLDARAVCVVTTPALQVLMAVRDHQQINDRTVAIEAPSTGFIDSIRMLGVSMERLQTRGTTA